ncbi:hypothetical protein [Sulfitobacter sp. MF3-043]|uniref:hypothetical protein n=1 Tax=Sulfitobacter sediminivivens TaxID=3252902 RepID=UPI003EBD0E31
MLFTITFIPRLSLTMRRLHDSGKSAMASVRMGMAFGGEDGDSNCNSIFAVTAILNAIG